VFVPKKFRHFFNYETVSYLFFGGLTTLVALGTYALFIYILGMGVAMAGAVSNVLAIIFAFVTNKMFVFQSPGWRAVILLPELAKFGASRAFTAVVDVFVLVLLVDVMGLNPMIMRLLTMVVIHVIGNYALSKWLVFTKGHATDVSCEMEYNEQLFEAIKRKLQLADTDGVFVWVTEYIGYLPYGQYQWLEIGDKDASAEFEFAWDYKDLVKLASTGLLVELTRQGFADEKEVVTYKLNHNWDIIDVGSNTKWLAELNAELSYEHPLYNKVKKSIARCYSQDDVLYQLDDGMYAVIHLTYSVKNKDGFPRYVIFEDLEEAGRYIATARDDLA